MHWLQPRPWSPSAKKAIAFLWLWAPWGGLQPVHAAAVWCSVPRALRGAGGDFGALDPVCWCAGPDFGGLSIQCAKSARRQKKRQKVAKKAPKSNVPCTGCRPARFPLGGASLCTPARLSLGGASLCTPAKTWQKKRQNVAKKAPKRNGLRSPRGAQSQKMHDGRRKGVAQIEDTKKTPRFRVHLGNFRFPFKKGPFCQILRCPFWPSGAQPLCAACHAFFGFGLHVGSAIHACRCSFLLFFELFSSARKKRTLCDRKRLD